MEIRDDELEHYGRKGMKWYQHIFGKEAAATRKRNKQLKKARKARQKKAEAAKKAAKQEEKKRAQRAKYLSDPGKLYKHRAEFSSEDIEQAMKRFDWEQKVRQNYMNRTTYAATVVGNYIKLAGNVVAGYNTAASVYNAWFPDEPLPVVDLSKVQTKGK